jgi:hypothetical protein
MILGPDSKLTHFLSRLPAFLTIWGTVYLIGVALFGLYRLLFFIQNHNRYVGASTWDISRAFLVGWRFDQVVILFVALPLLLILPWVSLRFRWVSAIMASFLTLAFTLLTLALLADIRFFKYYGSHLNYQAAMYLNEGSTTWHLILSEPMFYPFIAVTIALGAGLFLLWRRLFRFAASLPRRTGWSGRILWFLLCFALSFLGIRGRVSMAPIDWGNAYFSHNLAVNQLALNGVYTFGKAFTEEGRDPRIVYLPETARFPFVPFASGLDSLQTWLHGPNEDWMEPGKSLLRHVTQTPLRHDFRPNVVVVLMESWSGRNTGSLGATTNLTPEFDSLAAHGLLFTNFYANGTRTNYGMPAVLCGFPALPGRSIMVRYNAAHPFVCLSEILHDRGYFNAFAYGGDLAFDNLEGFFRNKKFDRFLGDDDFGKENVFAKWGVPDHIVFHDLVHKIDSFPRPFQVTALTLSNHEPFDLPDSSVQVFKDKSENSKILNAQRYADFALGKFLAEFRTRPVFDSTIFVFTADHAKWGAGKIDPDPLDFHVPLLVYSPKLLGSDPQRIQTVAGQVDILPTLMDLLGGSYIHASWGRDVLGVPRGDSGYAIVNVMNTLGIISDGYLYSETLGAEPFLYPLDELQTRVHDVKSAHSELVARLQRKLRTYVQIADQMTIPQAK